MLRGCLKYAVRADCPKITVLYSVRQRQRAADAVCEREMKLSDSLRED